MTRNPVVSMAAYCSEVVGILKIFLVVQEIGKRFFLVFRGIDIIGRGKFTGVEPVTIFERDVVVSNKPTCVPEIVIGNCPFTKGVCVKNNRVKVSKM